jgi:hypothetical protein
MARRKKRFSAVTGRKKGRWGRQVQMDVHVVVTRGGLAGRAYYATACPKAKYRLKFQRCGDGKGHTATAAIASSLRAMANKLK